MSELTANQKLTLKLVIAVTGAISALFMGFLLPFLIGLHDRHDLALYAVVSITFFVSGYMAGLSIWIWHRIRRSETP